MWLLAASCQTLTYQFLEKLDGGGPSEVSGIFSNRPCPIHFSRPDDVRPTGHASRQAGSFAVSLDDGLVQYPAELGGSCQAECVYVLREKGTIYIIYHIIISHCG